MSTGGTGGNLVRGVNYGVASDPQNVDPSDDPDPKGTAAGYVPDQKQGKSLLGTIKEALKPGDAKKQHQQGSGLRGDYTHDGRHGGVEETMIPGHRDYDESQESAQVHRDSTQSGGGVLESMMPGHKDHSDPKHGVFGAMKSAVDNTPDVPGALKRATGGGDPGSVGQSMSSGGSGDTGSKSTGGITGRTERNIKFDKLPVPDKYTEPSAE